MAKILSFKALLSGFRKQSISMRRRFVLSLISVLFFALALLLVLLSAFGVTDSVDDELNHIFNQQLDHSANQMSKDMHQLAACAVEFSSQMSTQIGEMDIEFADLKNNVSALTELQHRTYMTVLNNMRIADCSGAFYILDTTVNDSLDDQYYSGIHLRYANVGSYITIRNSVCMFRGAAEVARKNNINLFSTWEFETKKGSFPEMEAILEQAESNPTKTYLLTKAYKLPKSWEKVRLLCVPIFDDDSNIIGVCGFEISDPFFHSAYQASNAESPFIVCGMLEKDGDIYTGQIAPNTSGYIADVKGEFAISGKGSFLTFSNSDAALIGRAKEIIIGSSTHTVAVMLPQTQYDILVKSEMNKIVIMLILISLLTVVASIILSHGYIRPLLNTVEQIKSKQFDGDTQVQEFNDLFEYLAEQDRINEAEISRLRREKSDAMTAANEMQLKFDETVRQNERLAYSRKDELDPHDYEMFKNGIKTLTEKEKQVLDLYIEGKTVKDIMEIMQLQESTIRFHNRNIYSKLGVHSLKQLLRCAAILKQETETN